MSSIGEKIPAIFRLLERMTGKAKSADDTHCDKYRNCSEKRQNNSGAESSNTLLGSSCYNRRELPSSWPTYKRPVRRRSQRVSHNSRSEDFLSILIFRRAFLEEGPHFSVELILNSCEALNEHNGWNETVNAYNASVFHRR
jgi:hypothetical protein